MKGPSPPFGEARGFREFRARRQGDCRMGITAPLEDSITSPAADAPAPAVAGVLDRLRIGDRSEEALDGELQSLVESDPERAWELVSLLDQRFRRGEIRPADYRAVNSRLIAALLGSPRVTEQSPEPPATATSPPQDANILTSAGVSYLGPSTHT